ncbi:MAG: hypothetical protein CVU63_08560 [Deltaproteobacteria bacterium HGW-Deltaproteobacteria-20]|nr:MAG: hypothetical protein CVU63_08560 [Deltaproteobacteria bacterium HGW-Deltaproteobacteria-20]
MRASHGPWLVFSLALASCGVDDLPPEGQVVLHVATDAPLPLALGQVPPDSHVALFDRLSFEVFPPGSSEPCDACFRAFEVDEAMFRASRASVGIVSAAAGVRVRVRLFRGNLDAPSPRDTSTIESVAQVLAKLEGNPGLVEGLMRPFRAMVDFQLACIREDHQPRRLSERRRRPRPEPTAILTERARDIVCVAAQASTFPPGPAAEDRSELIHFVALRCATGERFETILRPSRPWAEGGLRLAELGEPELLGGESRERFPEAWSGFLRKDDVVCSWGYFPLTLLRWAGGEMPREHVDVRALAKRWARRGWTTLEGLTAELGLELAPVGRGRAGRHVGVLEAAVARMSEPRPGKRG